MSLFMAERSEYITFNRSLPHKPAYESIRARGREGMQAVQPAAAGLQQERSKLLAGGRELRSSLEKELPKALQHDRSSAGL